MCLGSFYKYNITWYQLATVSSTHLNTETKDKLRKMKSFDCRSRNLQIKLTAIGEVREVKRSLLWRNVLWLERLMLFVWRVRHMFRGRLLIRYVIQCVWNFVIIFSCYSCLLRIVRHRTTVLHLNVHSRQNSTVERITYGTLSCTRNTPDFYGKMCFTCNFTLIRISIHAYNCFHWNRDANDIVLATCCQFVGNHEVRQIR